MTKPASGPAYIYYRRGYKYQLTRAYKCRLPMTGHTVDHDFICLDPDGSLTIRAGYAWDGPSGPALDTANFMRGSLVHDVLYQLMGTGQLPVSCKDQADRILQAICREDGMSSIRAWWVYHAVKRFGDPRPSEYLPETVAP